MTDLDRAIIAIARKWGFRDGLNDPQGTQGPSRVHARTILEDCYSEASFTAYAGAYREASIAAGSR